ncbi:MAG TPA: hypothetical protein VFY20_14175 [Gemmatimonadales bacterium]|nr:hypothetical protein [Gemmatimonadales bacterium]
MTIPHQPGPSTPATPKKKRSWGFTLFLVLSIPLLLAALYTFFVLSWSYSDGERAGALRKFSRKGWLCKTYEGEMVLEPVNVANPQVWAFTVRDEAVVQQLNQAVGQRVHLHYTEHKGVPTTCFGETQFYVDQVKLTEAPGTLTVPAPAPTPAAPTPESAAPAPAAGQPTP